MHTHRCLADRRMNRQLKVNTAFPVETPQPSFATGPLTHPIQPSQYGPYPNGPGYFPPPQSAGYYQYPPDFAGPQSGPPVAGPSRRHSQPAFGVQMQQQQMYQGMPYDPSMGQPGPWDNVSVASSTGSQKRKRSDSSQTRNEQRTPQSVSTERPPARSANSGGAQQLPTPPSSGHLNSQALPEEKVEPRKGVYVTATQEEGRKLGLVHTKTGTEDVESTPTRGPPRMKATTTLSVSAAGKAVLSSAEVLQSELDMLEKSAQATPKTPQSGHPRTPTSGTRPEDTPGTVANKTTRRLSAFNLSARPSEPMYSIRLDMGQGQPCRVALRKDLALAFVGMDKATNVVEERRGEDEDAWAVVNGAPGSRPPVRPNWPDEEAPWKLGSAHRARQLREESERTAMLKRYLESSSDSEDDDDGAARFPSHRGSGAVRTKRLPVANGIADAKSALLAVLNRGRGPTAHRAPSVMVPTGVVNCVCKQTAAAGSMISCGSCRTWHHLACVGIDEVQLAPNWVCDPCVAQARRATLSSPSNRTPTARFSSHERSHSAFRGDVALALAPSPMFAGDNTQSTPMGTSNRTPMCPSRSRGHRARILSYNDPWDNVEDPGTPVPPPRIDQFLTPRPDDSMFDVNSTPSRHLNTDPRMAGQFNSLFAVTPLMGRSRNASGMATDTPAMVARNRNISGVPPFSDSGVVGRHEFLQGLTDERRAPNTEGPISPSLGRGRHLPESPTPYGAVGIGARPKQFGSLRAGAGSRSGLGLGMPIEGGEE